jgi:vancomycin permeability regulator SanA
LATFVTIYVRFQCLPHRHAGIVLSKVNAMPSTEAYTVRLANETNRITRAHKTHKYCVVAPKGQVQIPTPE